MKFKREKSPYYTSLFTTMINYQNKYLDKLGYTF